MVRYYGKLLKYFLSDAEQQDTQQSIIQWLLPAWMIGRNPKLKIIMTTHTGELAVRFGRKAKHLIDSPEYQEIFRTRLLHNMVLNSLRKIFLVLNYS